MANSGMKDMRIKASAEPSRGEDDCGGVAKNSIICCLSFTVIFLLGIIYGLATTPVQPFVSPQPGIQNQNASRPCTPGQIPLNPIVAPVASPATKPAVKIPHVLDAAEEELGKLRKLISSYYGGALKGIQHYGMGINPTRPYYVQSVKYVARNIVRAILKKQKYIIGTIGSSVAAGHDNCNYDSYERQLQRLLEPLWKALGSGIEVRNAGEGGGCSDSHANQIFCVQNMVGADVDLVHYSWTYFEGRERGYLQHEMLVRWALMMDKEPAVHIFNCGGDKKQGCLPDNRNQKLLNVYGPRYGYNAVCLDGALAGNGAYSGKKWSEIGDGIHNVTRYGEGLKDKYRRESLGVVWRNWHPGPLGFQLVSDMFALMHMDSVLTAIDMIKAMEKTKGRAALVSDFSFFEKPIMADDLPPPVFCDPKLCKVEDPPGCLNLEKPTYGWHQVSIVPVDDKLSPYSGKIKAPGSGGWTIVTTRPSGHLIPKREKSLSECQHLDSCGFVQAASPSQGWVVFKLPKMTLGMVVVCGCCGKHIAENMFLNNAHLQVQFDGKDLTNKTWTKWPNGKCARLLTNFPAEVNDSGGHLYLAFRIASDGGPKVGISHVIAM